MVVNFLLPHRWKPLGWGLLLLGGVLGFLFLLGYDDISWLNVKVPMLLHAGPHYFPLWALARYRNLKRSNTREVAYGI